ncbi:hypothetical protein SUGI_0743440 [Cryptomeria japonica]|uniref:uncharacterized protein LOC131065762 n=1 Tax=Cryptomeria japonica TaxID=3369 RepID=UPI002414A301|nr:uncharacterized protein LOC131065762 [Cryptomeria japonica]GLJ36841.1 hypothetical protein SUGI_0743440 [Cryptomeria japonica]
MGCASSKHLELVSQGEGLKRYTKSLSRSRNKKKNKKNTNIDDHHHDHHHHVALTSSTYGVFNPQTFESEEQEPPEKGKSCDSSTYQIYEKLKNFESESGPEPWSEVSKVLDNLKEKDRDLGQQGGIGVKINSFDSNTITFHTVEELDAKNSNEVGLGLRQTQGLDLDTPSINAPLNQDSFQNTLKKENLPEKNATTNKKFDEEKPSSAIVPAAGSADSEFADMSDKGPPSGRRVVEAKANPLDSFEEKCPPGGEKGVVLYTTSLRGIRKTFEDCNKVRSVLESYGVPIDERDVSMHLEFRNELKELMGQPVPVPRLFIKGRYIGGAEEVLQFNDDGKLDEFLNGLSTGTACKACDGCGGMRFVPCLECSGSCKLINNEGLSVRCPHCNENGLIQCPICC